MRLIAVAPTIPVRVMSRSTDVMLRGLVVLSCLVAGYNVLISHMSIVCVVIIHHPLVVAKLSMKVRVVFAIGIISTALIMIVISGIVAAEEEYLLLQNQVNKTGSPNVIVHTFFLAQLLPVNN